MSEGRAELEGRIAWVNGGAGAVGVAVSAELARAGAHVVVSGRNAVGLEAAIEKIAGSGSTEALVVDVSSSDSVFDGAAYIEKRHGRIDILVNSAGVNPTRRHFRDLSLEEWNNTVQVNLSGMFYACQAALIGMRERQEGVIVNIGSWAGRFAAYFAGPAYASTKRAVLALTETINMGELETRAGQDRERRDVAEHDRVAVGSGLRGELGADAATRAAAAVDDHLLTQLIAERERDDARGGVGAAPGRIRRDQPHGLGRVRLRVGAVRNTGRECRADQDSCCFHASSVVFSSPNPGLRTASWSPSP